MKTFKQFISEKGFVRRVGETIGVRDYVDAVDIIDKTETNPLKKRLRMDRLAKNNPLDVSKGGGTISNPKKPDDEKQFLIYYV